MSLDRQYGKVVFHCDECFETLDTDEANFSVAQGLARDEGWKTVKDKGDWHNLCPSCDKELTG